MYHNDRDTVDSRNPEDKESLSLRGEITTGCSDSLSAGVQEARQEETGLDCLYIIGVDSI